MSKIVRKEEREGVYICVFFVRRFLGIGIGFIRIIGR